MNSVPETPKIMPEISSTLTSSLAKAAKLHLTEEEIVKFTSDLGEILKAFSTLSQIGVEGVKPSFQPIQHKDVLREDVIMPSLTQEQTLSFTKQHENGFFVGPRTID